MEKNHHSLKSSESTESSKKARNPKIFVAIIGLLIVIFGSVFIFYVAKEKNKSNHATITLSVTTNGTPAVHMTYEAVNLEKAFEIIETGQFPNSLTTQTSWLSLQQSLNSSTTGSVITLANGLAMGPGITNTKNEAEVIVAQIIRTGNLSFLTNLQPYDPAISFHSPSNDNADFTDQAGRAEAVLTQGETAILDGNGTFYKFVAVSASTRTIDMDVSNLSSDLSFKLTGQPASEKNSFGQYIVESGAKLTFRLQLHQNFTGTDMIYQLSYSPGLSIDSVTDSLDHPLTLSALTDTVSTQVTTDDRGNNVAAQTTWNVQNITLPASADGEIVTVTAHVNPALSSAITSAGYTLKVTAANDYGQSIIATAPELNLSGINFVLANATTNSLVTGAQYVLGRKTGGETQLYSAEWGWRPVTDLTAIDSSQFLVLQGGYQYQLGNSNAVSIPYDTTRYNFNTKTSDRINQSLIQLSGLAAGSHYFLYQLAAPRGYARDTQEQAFSIFNQQKYTANNTLTMQTSISHATLSNKVGTSVAAPISLDSQIPDYLANNNEYHLLSVKGTLTPTSPSGQITLSLIVAAFVVFVLTFFAIGFDFVRSIHGK